MVMGSSKIGTDVLIIGAGPGGYVAAQRCGELGLTTTLVENVELGGTCLNVGCIPSKALINVGDLVNKVKEGAERGIVLNGEISIDFAKTQDWKNNKVVKRLTTGVGALMKAADVEVVRGKAHFKDSHTVQIDIEGGQAAIYGFKYCIIATGS
ncbi:MAG TPA: FAD-dependent oxidoreductase, partial [Symbiobacteriaceae bacterium]|nr:FAD-dependent oxidoreductase [Symbiobacteriaceae bacterium]